MTSAQTHRVCREGKPLHTFPDHALSRPISHRQPLQPAQERGFGPRRIAGQFDPIDPSEQLAKKRHDFGLRQVPADARVNAEAIAEMPVRRAVRNEFEGAIEGFLVAIAGWIS